MNANKVFDPIESPGSKYNNPLYDIQLATPIEITNQSSETPYLISKDDI